MNAKQTALDAYLARTTAIHAKLERLQQLADDHFGHDPDAIHWGHVGDLGRVDAGLVKSGTEIARREGLHHTTVNELLRLTLLAPELVRAILDGRQPKTLSLIWLKNNELPDGWEAQQVLFAGFDT